MFDLVTKSTHMRRKPNIRTANEQETAGVHRRRWRPGVWVSNYWLWYVQKSPDHTRSSLTATVVSLVTSVLWLLVSPPRVLNYHTARSPKSQHIDGELSKTSLEMVSTTNCEFNPYYDGKDVETDGTRHRARKFRRWKQKLKIIVALVRTMVFRNDTETD